MKKTYFSILLVIVLLLVSCNNINEDSLNLSSEQDIKAFLEKNNTGYIVISNEDEANFLTILENILLEKKEQALLFNTFYNDGKNKNSDKLSHNPFNFELPSVNTLYFIKDGSPIKSVELDIYSTKDLKSELIQFIEDVKEGDLNE